MKYILVPINNQPLNSHYLVSRPVYHLNDILNWSNGVLIERYFQVTKLVKTLEDEGRRREIVPFIPDEVIEEIFGAKAK